MSATPTRTIPFFDYQNAFKSVKKEFIDIFGELLGRGAFIMQKELEEFERKLADYLGVKYAFGVGNATDGMTLAWIAAELKPGDEVIFPSHTMVATPAAIHFAGGVPVPVDCGDDHLLDPRCVEAALTSRTRGLSPVQLNGRTCNMDAIQEIADEHNLIIVEDSAQALGSKFKGRLAGTFGKAGVFSFYPAKVLGCLGDGGAVVCNDDELGHRLSMLRDHGRDESGEIVMWGQNSRLDNLQAALLLLQFGDYSAIVTRRRELAALYQRRLAGVREVTLPPAPGSDVDHFDVYQNYEIEADRRDQLKTFLAENGIGTLIQWGGKAVHQFDKLGFDVHLPRTDALFKRCIMLPMNMCLSDDDVEFVSSKIVQFYET